MRAATTAIGVACASLLAGAVWAAAPKAGDPGPDADAAYARMVDAYMEGNWEALEKDLRVAGRPSAKLTPGQRADVAYLRQVKAECHPAWWEQCKAGQKMPLQATLWGKPFRAIYDPAGKSSIQVSLGPPQPTFTVCWKHDEMDSTAAAEYGFNKGELTGLGVWYTLGTALAWSGLPPQALMTSGEQEKLRLHLYSDFRGNLTGLYYGSPPARRWGLHIYLAAFMEKYGKGPAASARRATAAMFLVEVLKDPSKYPSLKLPEKLAAESAEEKLAVHFKFKIGRKTHWTIAEDRAFREAVKTFAAANERKVFDTGRVTLPNGLIFPLGAEEDAKARAKRDGWIKAQFDKAAGK